MNAPESIFLPDVQSTLDTRQLAIQPKGTHMSRFESIHKHSAYAELHGCNA